MVFKHWEDERFLNNVLHPLNSFHILKNMNYLNVCLMAYFITSCLFMRNM